MFATRYSLFAVHGLAAASPYIMQLLMHAHSRLWPHIQERLW
jgi:hypothetical protein